MNLYKNFALVFGVTLGLAAVAGATDFVHDGKVDVVQALGVAETVELDFGSVTDTTGTITLSLVDTITSDPSSIHVGGTVASGDYTISGEANLTVAVVLTGSTNAGLTIDTFTTSAADLNNVALGAGGSVVLTIGADLTVAAAAASAGADQLLNFTIAVTYN